MHGKTMMLQVMTEYKYKIQKGIKSGSLTRQRVRVEQNKTDGDKSSEDKAISEVSATSTTGSIARFETLLFNLSTQSGAHFLNKRVELACRVELL